MKKISLILLLAITNVFADNNLPCESMVLSQLREWGIEKPNWKEGESLKFFFVGNSSYRLTNLKESQILSREDASNKTEININNDCSIKYENTKKENLEVVPKNFKCKKEVLAIIGEWPKMKFSRSLTTEKGVKEYYKASSGKIGEWYFATVYKDHLNLMKKDFENLYIHEIDSESCYVSKKIVSHPQKEEDFTDEDLQTFADGKRNAAIYVWSPRMEVAIRGMKNFMESLESKKIPYRILLDLHADIDDAKEIAKKHNLPKDIFTRINSDDLIHRDVLNHFPTTVLIRDGEVISNPMHGYLNKDQFDKYFYNNGL